MVDAMWLYVSGTNCLLALWIATTCVSCFILDEVNTKPDEFQVWLTAGDTAALLDPQDAIVATDETSGFSVTVDRNNTRQVIEGYGASMTNAGAYVIYNSPHRHEIMQDLFGTDLNSLGSNQFSLDHLYYDIMVLNGHSFNSEKFDFFRFCVVIRFFSSPPQRPLTSDFEGFSIPDSFPLHLFSYLNS